MRCVGSSQGPRILGGGDAVHLAEFRPWLDEWTCAVAEKPFEVDVDVSADAVRSCLDGVARGPVPVA